MEVEELKREYTEWIKKVRLAHVKRLSTSNKPLENNEKEILIKIKQLLLESGLTEGDIDQEILQYKELTDEDKKQLLEDKVQNLVSQIISYLDDASEVSSKDYPELYHRIQELVALNPDVANELINDFFEREKISHFTSCGDSIYGGPCTYYFSKKPYFSNN